MSVTPHDFDYIKNLVFKHSAIVLDAGKEYLVSSRLNPVAKKAGVNSIGELVSKLKASGSAGLLTEVIEAMTTNETSFFRDLHPFETLKSAVFPQLIQARRTVKSLRIWCGASSSGQEPYTISMVIKENFPELANWNIQILCTDISQEMLDRTKNGEYSQLEVNRGLPITKLVKFFSQSGTQWKAKDDLRKFIHTQPLNLAGTWPSIGQFDLIFIRNVLIYFDSNTKKQIMAKVRSVLKPDGFFFLGATETTLNLDDKFERITTGKTTYYRKLA